MLLIAAAGVSAVGHAEALQIDRLVPTVARPGPVTARIDLGSEFPQMQDYVFRQALTVVTPRSGRPPHTYVGMPEIVRVLSGTLTDARNGAPPLSSMVRARLSSTLTAPSICGRIFAPSL